MVLAKAIAPQDLGVERLVTLGSSHPELQAL
jgi:hypothetical protein